MSPYVDYWSVCPSVGWSIRHNFLMGWELGSYTSLLLSRHLSEFKIVVKITLYFLTPAQRN